MEIIFLGWGKYCTELGMMGNHVITTRRKYQGKIERDKYINIFKSVVNM